MKAQKPLSKPARVDHAALKRASAAIRNADLRGRHNIQITWEGASYQSAASAAVADVRTPDGKTHRLYVKRTMPKARTFHGLIDGTVVGVWGGFEMAKAGLADLFERGAVWTRHWPKAAVERRSEERRRINDRAARTLIAQGAAKLEELQALLKRVQGALGTEETGDALVQVARDAAGAEQALARLQRDIGDGS